MLCQNPTFFGGVPRRCGHCDACRVNTLQQWFCRCKLEASCYSENSFITLTYNDEHIPERCNLIKSDLQDFFKRFRKDRPIRYYACGEYGDKSGRCHFHFLGFGLSSDDIGYVEKAWTLDNKPIGFVECTPLVDERIKYCLGYVQKKMWKKVDLDPDGLLPDGRNPEFRVMSRRPGIGYPALQNIDLSDLYLLQAFINQKAQLFGFDGQKKLFFDRYLREKLIPDFVREYNKTPILKRFFKKDEKKAYFCDFSLDNGFKVCSHNEYLLYCAENNLKHDIDSYREFYRQRLAEESFRLAIFKKEKEKC